MKRPFKDKSGKSIQDDSIYSPSHYTYGGIEVIDILRAKMTPEMLEGYLMGNLLGYIFRYRLKDSPLTDLKKAKVYLNWLIEKIEENSKNGK